MSLKPGELFRRFRVLGKAGEGGMGVVYQAHDTKLDRDVALKFVTQAGEFKSELRDRLLREARSLATLNHPNIVAIHDIDEDNGVPFLVLEWIAGRPLSDPSFSRQLSLEEFFRIALSVSEALASAHDRGIIHRDVKPSNVLVSNDGRIKVVDFGLAKFRQPDPEWIQTAGTAGTLAYMSPEQANGATIQPASDVFSFGILAYELLTGERPFKGNGPGDLLAAIMGGFYVPLVQLRSDLPGALVSVVERCLEKEPGRRFSDGGELLVALQRVSAGGGSSEVEELTTIEFSPSSSTLAQHPDIQFAAAADGVRLAYSVIGSGRPLIRVVGFFTHLEKEWEWPDLRHLWERLAERYTVIRYDGRGIGLSDRYAGEFTEETRQFDLDAVFNEIGAKEALLFGISEGGWTAASYAIRHPERTSHLILYGAYARGSSARPHYDPDENEAVLTLVRKGWGLDTPKFRQVITSQFFRPDADPRLIAHFNDMQRASADPDTAARYLQSCNARGDGRDMFRQITVPTLVVQCRDDMAIPADEARLLASLIPGAHMVMLPSGSHYFPTDREVVTKLVGAINRFVDGGDER